MKENKRSLAHIERIHSIRPIEGADNIELVHVLGWQLIAKKSEFREGDLCVYIEIDSKVPSDKKCFEFLANKDYKIKTMKLGKFNVVSQGIALPIYLFETELKKVNIKEGVDVTKQLKITKIQEERELDEVNLSESIKLLVYKNNHPKLFKNKFINWLLKFNWFKKFILFKYNLEKKNYSNLWPSEVSKTDEIRCENIPDILNNYEKWIRTEKVDGSSSTYFLKRKGKKFIFTVCSRNQVQNKVTGIPCYYEMAEKYDIENFLKLYLLQNPKTEWVCLQGEIIGPKIQGNPYKLTENQLYIFNFIDSVNGRFNSNNMVYLLKGSKLNTVPILETDTIPNTMELLKEEAEGKSRINPNVNREGIVYRSLDGKRSFKNVSNTYLLKKGSKK